MDIASGIASSAHMTKLVSTLFSKAASFRDSQKFGEIRIEFMTQLADVLAATAQSCVDKQNLVETINNLKQENIALKEKLHKRD